MSIAFIDLKAQRARLKDRIDAAVMRVLDHAGFVMGPEVLEFERQLGAFGGAVLTNDADLHAVLVSLRNHGAGADKYDNVRIGLNSRLDTIQAAILIEKLAVFPDEIVARGRIADRYAAELKGAVATPAVIAGGVSTWAQYTIETDDRDGLAAGLREQGIPTAMYYPKPIHMQTAYRGYPVGGNGLPVTMAAAERVISLPMHSDLEEATQDRIVAAVRAFTG